MLHPRADLFGKCPTVGKEKWKNVQQMSVGGGGGGREGGWASLELIEPLLTSFTCMTRILHCARISPVTPCILLGRFPYPTLATWWTFHLLHFSTELKIHLPFFIHYFLIVVKISLWGVAKWLCTSQLAPPPVTQAEFPTPPPLPSHKLCFWLDCGII